jgi:hypothetical protein
MLENNEKNLKKNSIPPLKFEHMGAQKVQL